MAEAIDPARWQSILDFASAAQRESVEMLVQHGSVEAAADALGISPLRLRGRLEAIEHDAARRGWNPDLKTTEVSPGFHIKGLTTYGKYEEQADGTFKHKPTGGWVKVDENKDAQLARVLDAISEIAEPLRGMSEPVSAPAFADEDLLAVYPHGDPHLGMYAWAEECGESFDLEIAERQIVRAMQLSVDRSPPASTAVVALMGDTFHADNMQNRTMRSGHALDVDTRWAKVLRVGVRASRALVDCAKRKHRRVRMVVIPGNHDDHSSMALAIALDAFYSNDDRVEVDLSPAQHRYVEHGRCLLGFNHGHMSKPDQLQGDMTAQSAWGSTRFRHYYVGHIHTRRVVEQPGVVIEYLRTLAARDAFAAGAGYRSDRDLLCDVWHRQWGLRARNVVGIEEVMAA